MIRLSRLLGEELKAALAVLILLATPLSARAARAPLSQWAVAVIAGDDRAAHEDRPTEAFDNARRDLAKALWRAGFSPAATAQFSAEASDDSPGLLPDSAGLLQRRLTNLAAQAPAGCLIYLTSHGSPDGAVFGERLLSPRRLAAIVDRACGTRPTAVIVSACFSGVFVPALAGPQRMVLTAARRDRSSFGCGESDRYPFFDACMLEALPAAADLIALAPRAMACVRRKEDEAGLRPRSEPQLAVGARFREALAPFTRLAAPAPPP